MRRLSIYALAALSALAILTASDQAVLLVASTTQPFTYNWDGTPAIPQSAVPANWDVQIHTRAPGDSMESMQAQHGADCGAPPATHLINTLAQGVFICKNHLMTAIGDSGYGEIVLTPDHLVDFSQGTATVTVSASTLQLNPFDWVEIWITPFSENISAPIEFDVDLQGAPKDAVRFSLNRGADIGTYEGDVARFVNGNGTAQPRTSDPNSLASLGLSSPSVRTTYQIDISQTHIRFGLPAYNVWWTDTNIASLPFTQGIVQIVHHSYNPLKHAPGTGVDTWHWSNFSISNAVPFTIINGMERSINASGTTTVHFPAASPSGSFLRFSGIGTLQVSFDGGASWQNAVKQANQSTGDPGGHFASYWAPMPSGVQTVQFRGTNWYGGPWWARDPSIWSLSAASTPLPSPSPSPIASPTPSPSPTASPSPSPIASPTPRPTPSAIPSPSPTASPSPRPTPMPISRMPCTVIINGVPMSGTCSGTFTQS